MSVASTTPPGLSRDTPYDLEAIGSGDEWRRTLAWPFAPIRLRKLIEQSLAGYLELLDTAEDDFSRRLMLASVGFFFGGILASYEKVLCLEGENSLGIRFTCDMPEFIYLRGDGSGPPPRFESNLRYTDVKLPTYAPVRHARAMAQWTTPWRLPATALAPNATAISLNDLLRDNLERDTGRISYRDAKVILMKARRLAPNTASTDAVQATIQLLTTFFSDLPGFSEPYVLQLRDLVEAQVAPVLERVALDLMGLERLRRVPGKVWSGTAGNYSSRLVGLEALRRGGQAIRFDHGGSTGLTSPFEIITLIELQASSQFVMGTPELAKITRAGGAARIGDGDRSGNITGASGFPHLHRLPLDAPPRSVGKRKIMYLSSFVHSRRKNATHALSELVYTDWTMRLAAALAKLPVDLMCKPHPTSRLADGHHLLEDIAPTSHEPFERVMGEADVYVFDAINSTAFWEAVCTNLPVVYIDLGQVRRNPLIEPLIRERCRVLEARYDANNLPQVDAEELAEAVAGGIDSANPGAFRRLFMGA
jgi:hypothetical protein